MNLPARHASTNRSRPFISRLALAAAVISLGGCANESSVAKSEPASREARTSASRPQNEGTAVPRPVSLPANDPRALSISCQATCSQSIPRSAAMEIRWSDAADLESGSAQLAPNRRRIDIAIGGGGFAEGTYATLDLSEIPERTPGGDPNSAPVGRLLKGVVEHRTAGRVPNSGLKMRATRTIEKRRGQMQRSIRIEGAQPSVTYTVRLVVDGKARALVAAEDVCRVPACPADFVRP